MKVQHPDSPWLWNPEWAARRIRDGNRTGVFVGWGFAIFWNAVSSPALIFGRDEIAAKGTAVVALVALFPIVGVFLLGWAVYGTMRYLKYGVSELELTTLPGVIGGRLAGIIHTGLQHPPDEATLSLDCLERYRTKDSTHEKLVWQEQQRLPGTHLSRSYRGVSVPVDFGVPYECRPSDPENGSNGILWRLSLRAETPGVDYGSSFEVPVFKTAQSRESGAAEHSFRRIEPAPIPPGRSVVRRRTLPSGAVEYSVPPMQEIGAAIGATVFLAIWMGTIPLQLQFGAPMIFPIVTGLVGLLIVLLALTLWFGASEVRVENGAVHIHGKVLGIGRAQAIRCSEVAEVKVAIGMRQNESMTQNAKAWYNVEIHRRGGRRKVALSNIREKQEAQQVADELELAIAGGQAPPLDAAAGFL